MNLDDSIMSRLKQEAARRGCTMSELMESAIRRFLEEKQPPKILPALPSFWLGGALVDIADRNALYDAMEER